MPNRFWVGGTDNWDGNIGTKWASVSGGSGGQSVPTTSDDVFFDSASTGTCTIVAGNSGAKSITCTGFTGEIAGAAAISVAGSVTLAATHTYSYTGRMTFTGTGTLTTAGQLFNPFTVNGSGITYGLGDDFLFNGSIGNQSIIITQGTFNTNNYTIDMSAGGNGINISGASTRTVNLGSSTIYVSPFFGTLWNAGTTTNLTFNAGTSTFYFDTIGGTGTFTGGGLTYNNVICNGSANKTIAGANTFANFTINPPTGGISTILFSGNQTVSGTLTCSGTTAIDRVFLRSNTLGTQRTLTVTTLAASNTDFQDIVLTNAASPTGAGNCGNNSGITFPAAKTVYWNLAGGGNWSSTAWAATSGASPAVSNFPLAQDTAIVEATGLNSGTTITINDLWNIGSIDLTARTTNTVTLASSTRTINYYGDYKLGSGVSVTGTGAASFIGRTTQNITSAGNNITFPITVDGSGTSFKLAGATTLTNTFTHTQGTVDCNAYTLTCTTFNSSNANTRTIAFGSGNITVTTTTASATAWTTATITNLTITGTPVVNVTNSTANAITVAAGALAEASSISFNFTAGSYSLTLSGTPRSLDFTGFSGTLPSTARTIYGDLKLSSAMTVASGAGAFTFGSTVATTRTITSNGTNFGSPITFNGVGGTFRLEDALTVNVLRTVTLTNGTLNLNGKTLTCLSSVGSGFVVAAGTKNITFNGGIINVNGFTNNAPTNFSTTAGTGTGELRVLGTFTGGGSTYNCTLAASGNLSFVGSTNNTFTTISNLTSPLSLQFIAGTTTTVTNWNVSGTSGNNVTIGSATAANHTLTKVTGSGNVVANYLTISRSTATGTGITWYAGANSTDGGNNSGWLFSSPASKVFGTIIT